MLLFWVWLCKDRHCIHLANQWKNCVWANKLVWVAQWLCEIHSQDLFKTHIAIPARNAFLIFFLMLSYCKNFKFTCSIRRFHFGIALSLLKYFRFCSYRTHTCLSKIVCYDRHNRRWTKCDCPRSNVSISKLCNMKNERSSSLSKLLGSKLNIFFGELILKVCSADLFTATEYTTRNTE